MRKLYKGGEWVVYNGKRYQVEVDYEDHVYLKGMKEPVLPEQIKPA